MTSLSYYLKEIQKKLILEPEKEKELILLAKDGNKRAFDRVIESNLRFVVSIAKTYQGQGVLLEDLIAEGNVGLIRSFEKFDPKRGFKFITYAVWWIRQAIINSIYENARLIRLPANKISLVGKINKIRKQLEQSTGKDPTMDELYLELEKHGIYDNINSLLFHFVDIDKEGVDGTNIHEVIPDDNELPNKEIEEKYLQKDILEALEDFTDREQEIIKMYFGIGEIRNHTLEEVGADFGVTRERIRQIKEAVLKKLRMRHRREKLQIHIEDE